MLHGVEQDYDYHADDSKLYYLVQIKNLHCKLGSDLLSRVF